MKLRWEFVLENIGYCLVLSVYYCKDDNDNIELGVDIGGIIGECIELNWIGFYIMDNWEFVGGVEYL